MEYEGHNYGRIDQEFVMIGVDHIETTRICEAVVQVAYYKSTILQYIYIYCVC